MKKKSKANPDTVKMDATGQSLGRLASKIAYHLQGKHKPDFNNNLPGQTTVIVNNLDKLVFKGNKPLTKIYYKHTGYIGHLKESTLKMSWEKNLKFVLKKAVLGMLPKNKLRARRIKRLIIK